MISSKRQERKDTLHLALGLVNHVDGVLTDPFLSASLEPFADVSRITLVAILRPAALRPSH